MITTIVGIGLIGGSIAKDIRRDNFASKIIAVDSNPENENLALSLKLVDEVLPLEEAIAISDLVILAVPVDVSVELIHKILDLIPEHCIVTDVGSTKSKICRSIINHKNRKNFVAGHPIAGTENVGPEAAISNLFQHKIGIICEKELSSKNAFDLITDLYTRLGMKIKLMGSEDHDKHIAYVSHLSHITSFALGKTVLNIEKNEANIFDLAGSGFSSTARLAMSSPDMWQAIFSQNSDHIMDALDNYIKEVNDFRDALISNNTDKLRHFMEEANEVRRILKK